MDERVVERREDVGNAESELTLSDDWAELDMLDLLLDLNFFARHGFCERGGGGEREGQGARRGNEK